MTSKRATKKRTQKEAQKEEKRKAQGVKTPEDVSRPSTSTPGQDTPLVAPPKTEPSVQPLRQPGTTASMFQKQGWWRKIYSSPKISFTIGIVSLAIGLIGLVITVFALKQATEANIAATEVNETLKETTKNTETLTIKMAIQSGALKKEIVLSEVEQEKLAGLVKVINKKTPSARTAEDWATLGYNISRNDMDTKQISEAIQYFKKATYVENDYAEAHLNIGKLYALKYLFESEVYNRFLDEDSVIIERNLRSIDDLKKSMNNYFLEAEEPLRRAIELKPDYAEAYTALANLYFQQDKKDNLRGIEYMQKAIELDPGNIHGYVVLGTAYANQNLYSKAMEHYKKAVSIKSGNSNSKKMAYYYMGAAYAQRDSFRQAINAYREAINIDSDYSDVYFAMGDAYFKQRQYLQAIENFQRVVEIDPNDANTYNSIGTAYYMEGNYGQAIKYINLALEKDPNDVEIKRNLQSVLEFLHKK